MNECKVTGLTRQCYKLWPVFQTLASGSLLMYSDLRDNDEVHEQLQGCPTTLEALQAHQYLVEKPVQEQVSLMAEMG